jgi:formylglycine-generating enzyme
MKTNPSTPMMLFILFVSLSIFTSCNKDDENLPILLTTEVVQQNLTSATGGGVICCEGEAAVTERGVCWNTTGQPSIQDSKTTDGSGTGIFTSEISDLTTGTLYYVRAYATNSFGTAYGNEVEYTTQQDFNIETVSIPAGTFIMGSPANEVGRHEMENQHEVTLNAFQMGKYEITNEQFARFMNAKNVPEFPHLFEGGPMLIYPSHYDEWGDCKIMYADSQWIVQPGYEKHPVVWVDWYGALEFATYLGARLPTEAEWEYACRAGTTTPFYTGNCISDTDAAFKWTRTYTDCASNSASWNRITFEVGSFPPNPWGLYDMHGNVTEWCSDFKNDDFYTAEPQTNPKGPETGYRHASRGGSFDTSPTDCRSADRGTADVNSYSDMGFRVAFDK